MQWTHREGASTLPRTKSKSYSSPALSEKPSISISPAQKQDHCLTLSSRRLKPSDSLHLPPSERADPSPPPDHRLPRVSSTLPVPTLRLSPSPTSLCQGADPDGSGTRQPSPVARERHARSISILNTNIEPASSNERSVNEARHYVVDSLMEVTTLSGECPVTYRESHRQAAETQNSFVLHQKLYAVKNESSNADKLKNPPRKIGVPTILQPNLNSKKQLEFLPNAATGALTSEPGGITLTDVQRKSQLPFDVRPTHSGLNLHGKHRTAQTRFGLKEPSQEHLCAGRNADVPATPPGSDSTGRFWNQSTVIPKPRQFDFNAARNTDAELPSGSTLTRPLHENIGPHQQTSATQTSPQKHRSCPRTENTSTQKNVKSILNQSNSAVRDCCFRSKSEACQDSYLSQSKLYLLSLDQQQVVFPAKCSTSQSDSTQRSPAQYKRHTAVNLSDTELNQTAEGPAELPECSSQSHVENRPLCVEQRWRSPNGSGNKSNGVFEFLAQPQQGVYQRAADTTPMGSPLLTQSNYRHPNGAVFLEEDPYYVTMYHPGSVYVGE